MAMLVATKQHPVWYSTARLVAFCGTCEQSLRSVNKRLERLARARGPLMQGRAGTRPRASDHCQSQRIIRTSSLLHALDSGASFATLSQASHQSTRLGGTSVSPPIEHVSVRSNAIKLQSMLSCTSFKHHRYLRCQSSGPTSSI
jgi:hypothetical protein